MKAQHGSLERNPVYVDVVLQPGFAFARDYMARYMLEINVAHVLMLLHEGHMRPDLGAKLLQHIGPIMESPDLPQQYDPAFEDLFFMIEAETAAHVGPDAVGNMHLAMSRNDMDTAMFRMAARVRIAELAGLLNQLRQTLIRVAQREVDTVMPAYTHNQQAQPTTMGHYQAAVAAALARDSQRFDGAWRHTNLSPLGAAALAGTGFRVDRKFEAELLGFEDLVENTYDAVAAADYLIETSSCCAILASDLSRFVCDLLYWATNEVSAIILHPSFIQVSSIMPQKRNPVALEHLRALLSKVLASTQSALALLHNVPFGDINDAGEQLQPVVHAQCDMLAKCLRLLDQVVATMCIDRNLLLQRVADGFSTSTELADTLVRKDRLSFRVAHQVVATLVDKLLAEQRLWRQLSLDELQTAMYAITGQASTLSEADLAATLDPVEFIARRSNVGAPAHEQLTAALARQQTKLQVTQQLWHGRQGMLQGYKARLSAAWREVVSQGQEV